MSVKGGEPVLVAGGAGFIGSHAVLALLEEGYRVLTVDDLSAGHREAVQGRDFLELGLRDREGIARAVKSFRPKVVLHFAAHCYVGESVLDPARYYGNNVASMLNLLDACREGGVEGFVFSSTAATYGEPRSVPITEDHPQSPINPYGRTKLVGEGMLRDYERAYGMRWVALRYFNAAGADPRGRLGEHHEPETHLIPLVLQTALGQRKELDVYGTDYDTRDGSCIRDYIHVTDLARAHVLALEHLRGGGGSEAFNLGNSQGTSVLEVLAAAEGVTGGPIARRECPRREGDPAILVADPGKITRALGWQPEYPDIADIVRTAWEWMSAHPQGYGS